MWKIVKTVVSASLRSSISPRTSHWHAMNKILPQLWTRQQWIFYLLHGFWLTLLYKLSLVTSFFALGIESKLLNVERIAPSTADALNQLAWWRYYLVTVTYCDRVVSRSRVLFTHFSLPRLFCDRILWIEEYTVRWLNALPRSHRTCAAWVQ